MVEPSAIKAESNALAKLQKLISLYALQILQCKGLDFVGECLNAFAASGLLSIENVIHLSNILERTRQFFTTFERAIRAEDNLKAAKTAHEASRPEVEAIKAKKTQLANFDH